MFSLDLPQGIVLLITDQPSAPADFFLHKTLHQNLKYNTDASLTKATILSVSEGLARWKSIASKSNLNLDHHLTAQPPTLEFIDVLSHIGVPFSASQTQAETATPSLKPIFDVFSASLSKHPAAEHIVILDDITTLEWIGFELLDVMRFVRALRAACIKANATLFVRHHRLSDEPDDLFRHLYQLCTYHLEVRGLASGRSGAVSGEIALHPGPATTPKDVNIIPRSRAVQYRLTDANAVYFEKGTAVAVT
ncbi:hypothetical protein AX14_005356 [Amanita brunnescens Koide BX004]|nr:hypothetical protein AX14_005356 [Amanita brunnescens Koide BX004]